MDAEEPYVGPKAIADYLNLSTYTVRVHAKNGVIPAVKIGGAWRFRLSDVRAHLEQPTDPWAQSPQSRGRRRVA